MVASLKSARHILTPFGIPISSTPLAHPSIHYNKRPEKNTLEMNRVAYASSSSSSIRRPIPIQNAQLTLIHTVSIRHSPRRRLTGPRLTPSLGPDIRASADANPPRPVVTSWAPGPSCAACDGEMVPAERKPRTLSPDECAEQQVESKVAEIGEARAGDVDGGAYGDENEN